MSRVIHRGHLPDRPLDVVTGAFSYTGRAIALRLLADGRRVRTLTRHSDPSGELQSRIEAMPLRFHDPAALVRSLRGAATLYNTYWIRFERGASTFARAVENTRALIRAAEAAGVGRVVHLSVSNPSARSPLPYFRGKAEIERELAASGLSHAVVRPTLIFGPEDILVNNIAWLLRRLPLFLVPGSGSYRVQPVSVDDTARIAVEAARGAANVTVDAAGPETYTFDEVVARIARAVRSRAHIVHAPPGVALGLTRLVGATLRDVVLTADELEGLMASLLVSTAPPTGRDSFAAWLDQHAGELGRRYVSEVARNYAHAPL